MDVHQFDALVLRLAEATTRRHTLGVVGASVLGGLVATSFRDDAEAKKKKKSRKKKQCSECRKCKKGKCKPKPNGTPCSTGECQNGACQGETCPLERICEESDLCCPSEVVCTDGACYCPENFALCSCPAGSQICTGTLTQSCCLAADTCDSLGFCITETCSAENAVCQAETAYCGDTCACFTTATEAQVCADYGATGGDICPDTSECANDGQCGAGEVCVDVSCCEPDSGFIGRCLPGCPAGRKGMPASGNRNARRIVSHLPRQ